MFGLAANPFQESEDFLVQIDTDRTIEVVALLKSAQKTVLLSATSQASRNQMLEMIRSQLDPQKVSVFRASLLTTEWDLLDHLSIELGLKSNVHDHRNLEEKLCELLQVQFKSGSSFVYLIDDAHLLNTEVVRFVLQFAHESRLSLVLISPDSQIFRKYSDTRLYRWILKKFTLDTTHQYLESRFNSAGIALPPIFNQSVIQWIYEQGKNDQNRMDAAALEVMQHAKLEPVGTTRWDILHFLVCALLVVLLCPGIYLLGTSVLSAGSERLDADGFSAVGQVPAVASPLYPLKVSGFTHSSGDSGSVATGNSRDNPDLQLTAAVQVEKSTEGSHSPPALKLPFKISNQWLKQMDPELFTVQVIASHSREKIERLMARDGLTQGYGWFESRFQDQPWHVVIKGIYSDRDSARYAVESIKANTGLEPWVRSFRSIQEDL
jgi:DamX protein